LIQAPEVGVRHLIAQGKLVEMMPQYLTEPMPVTLLYANRRHLPKRAQVFMRWMMEIMRAHVV
jgi:DNA-binding transcriptional LysR family regulator